jgi:excisionase family DNA binding protein
MTTDEAAAARGVSARRVLAMIKAGRLHAEKRGRDWWIEEADLEPVRVRKVGRPPLKAGPEGTPTS